MKIKKLIKLLIPYSLFLIPFVILAQDEGPFGDYLNLVGDGAGYETGNADNFYLQMLGAIVFTLLGLLGIIFTILTIYGGFRWMLARGNEDEVKKGKDIIKDSVIGLAVVVGAYAIWRFIAQIIFN